MGRFPTEIYTYTAVATEALLDTKVNELRIIVFLERALTFTSVPFLTS